MEAPIIDYLSISVPIPNLLTQWDISYKEDIPFYVDDRTWRLSEYLVRQENWREHPKNGIFKRHIQFLDIGVNYFDGHNSVSLIQFSGKGMEVLRNDDSDFQLLTDWQDRLTRLDIATDIICDIEPEDIAKCRGASRLKDGGHHPSDTGTTWYIGSRKSDRFARVYRYDPPLPRSDRVRIEFQLNDEQAKHAAKNILDTDIFSYRNALFSLAGFNHPVLGDQKKTPRATSAPRLASKGGTVHWLHKAVLPAIRKIAENRDTEVLIAFESQLRAILDEIGISRKD